MLTGCVRVLTAFEDTSPSVYPTFSTIVTFVQLKVAASFVVPCLYSAIAGPYRLREIMIDGILVKFVVSNY